MSSLRKVLLAPALLLGAPVALAQVTSPATTLATMPDTSSLGEAFALQPLPGAESEARWVARRLGGRPLIGPAATESAARTALPSAKVIHLATHGYAYSTEARTRWSFVALAKDSTDDGFLTVGELLDDPILRLQAELVVLSACQSGLGDLTQAEGTVGFQRAFLARGAKSVLVSQWNVSDSATALLMQGFYTHWLADPDRPSKAEALRRAQLALRSDSTFSAPKYWAGFQLVGSP